MTAIPAVGDWVRLDKVLNATELDVDDVIRVGCVSMKTAEEPTRLSQYGDAIWVTTGASPIGKPNERFGWVTCTVLPRHTRTLPYEINCIRPPDGFASRFVLQEEWDKEQERPRLTDPMQGQYHISSYENHIKQGNVHSEPEYPDAGADPTVPHGYPSWRDYAKALERQLDGAEAEAQAMQDRFRELEVESATFETDLGYARFECDRLRSERTNHRRELRRLNAAQRTLKLENEVLKGRQGGDKVQGPDSEFQKECVAAYERTIGKMTQAVAPAVKSWFKYDNGCGGAIPTVSVETVTVNTHPELFDAGPVGCRICSRPDCDNPNGKH